MSSRIHHHTLLLVFIIILSACTSPTPPPPAITPVLEELTPPPSPTSPLATVRPTQTIEATPTPEPYTGSLAGLIYYDQQGIWKIAQDGEHELIFDFEGQQYGRIRISPNLDKIVYGRIMTDISTSDTVDLNAYGDYRMCQIDWWPARPDILLVGIRPVDEEIGRFCEGIPAIKIWNGTLVEVLGTKPSLPASISGSPNGNLVAFDDNAVPWIFTWGEGKEPLRLASFGFPIIDNIGLTDPTWSPSGRWLAWIVFGEGNGESIGGIGIFDMISKTSKFLSPYYVGGTDAARAYMEWSPDETHIVLINHGENYIGVIDLELQETVYSSENVLSGFVALSPDGKWIAHYEAARQGTRWPNVVASLDGDILYYLPQMSFEQWSPDSSLLLMEDNEGVFTEVGAFYTFNLTTGKYYFTDLPSDIHTLAWAPD